MCLRRRLWTVADAPSRVSHRRTIHRRCSRIFCAASHTVGDNKLCGIYLIFHLDLYYIMGSQQQWPLGGLAARTQVAAALKHLVNTRMAVAAVLSPEWATEVSLTTRVHVPMFHRPRLNNEMIFGERASVLEMSAVTIADAPFRISHRRTIHRRCSRIFCVASHTVGDNKLCGIYLIFHLDMNYIMGSQWQWTVFELLDLLSAVNMQL